LLLSPVVEVNVSSTFENAQKMNPETKRIISKLTALFSLDSFGGGFLTDALVSYWFFRRFGLSEHDRGVVFFVVAAALVSRMDSMTTLPLQSITATEIVA